MMKQNMLMSLMAAPILSAELAAAQMSPTLSKASSDVYTSYKKQANPLDNATYKALQHSVHGKTVIQNGKKKNFHLIQEMGIMTFSDDPLPYGVFIADKDTFLVKPYASKDKALVTRARYLEYDKFAAKKRGRKAENYETYTWRNFSTDTDVYSDTFAGQTIVDQKRRTDKPRVYQVGLERYHRRSLVKNNLHKEKVPVVSKVAAKQSNSVMAKPRVAMPAAPVVQNFKLLDAFAINKTQSGCSIALVTSAKDTLVVSPIKSGFKSVPILYMQPQEGVKTQLAFKQNEHLVFTPDGQGAFNENGQHCPVTVRCFDPRHDVVADQHGRQPSASIDTRLLTLAKLAAPQ